MALAQLASRLTTRGWMILGGGAIAGVLFIYLFLHMVSQPSYTTLVSGVDPSQTGKMTSELSSQGINYQLQNNGTAIAVQSDESSKARVALAGAGLLGEAQPGFSQLFEKQSLGESNFQQRVTYQRALQGQLANMIDNIHGISDAQVELVLPDSQNQIFGEGQENSSAAVLLSGTSGLEPSTARSIAQLVASSVPGLSTSKVTITGGSGEPLWPNPSSEGAGGGTSKQAAEQRYDQSMQATLDAVLAQTLGAGKAEVLVNANVNADQSTKESLEYGKAGVPLTQSKDTETLTGKGAGAGATGTANLPAAATSGNSNYKHEVTNSTLGVNKTVTHSTIPPGAVENQQVSVLLDRSVPAASVPAIKEAITNAAGIEPKRGDKISIGQIAFVKPATTSASSSSSILGDAKYALIGIASLLFLFFTTRALRKREQEPVDHEPVWLRELKAPVRLSELETAGRPTEVMAAVGAGNGNGNGNGNGTNPVRAQVEQLVESDPDAVAQQLRNWMQES